MPEMKPIMIADKLQSVLGAECLNALGKESGFCERLRDIHPARLATAAITSLGTQDVATLSDIQLKLNELYPINVNYKPFHNQLSKASFPGFAQGVFESLLGELCSKSLEPVPDGVLDGFEDLVLQDGSSFAVHEGLAEAFPGRFKKHSPAAVELHAEMSVFSNQVTRVVLTPDTTSERAHLPQPETLDNKLLLADAGYEDLLYFQRVVDAGGHVLCRLKGNSNPWLTACYHQEERFDFSPRVKLKELRHIFEGHNGDLDVHWRKAGQTLAFRLVLIWNPVEESHMVLVTNLDRQRAPDPATLRTIYCLRWQIELLFKEWKSFANLHKYNTQKPGIAEGLIWFSLAAAILKRFIALAAEAVYTGFEVSTLKAARALRNKLQALILAIPTPRELPRVIGDVLDYLHHNAGRAHPSRDRLKGRLQIGLRTIGEAKLLQQLEALST